MPIQRIYQELSALNYVLGDLVEASRMTQREVHFLTGEMSALKHQVERLEDREYGRRSSDKPAWGARDYLWAGWGVVLVLGAVFDKVPWSIVHSFISHQK